MPESLKNDDKSIRSYILNDVLEEVPIDKSYENLCKVIGNDAIAFYDFQFWYYRFLSGKQDLDFDRSSEPEPLQFSDLPVDAVGLIVDKLKVEEILMLRRVSKSLQEFIEKQEFDCTSINVDCGDDFNSVSYGNRAIFYAKNDEAVKLYEERVLMWKKPLIIHGDDYESDALNDLAWILKNSKLQLCKFVFSVTLPCSKNGVLSTFLTKFKYELKSLKHQIAVRELELQPEYRENFLAILPYLKPGYLEKITIDTIGGFYDWESDEHSLEVKQIMQLDQWKQAKELILLDSLNLFPDEVFGQFNKYSIEVPSLFKNQLAHIGSIFADSPIFEHCRFNVWHPYRGLIDSIGVPGPAAEGYRFVRHLMILNTDKLLVFKESIYDDVEIEKKARDAQ